MVTLKRQTPYVVDHTVLQDLVPLNSLTDTRFMEISRGFKVENICAGRFLFGAGECDNRSLYLLDGEVNFIDANGRVTGIVSAGMEPARYPLANQQPRLVSARTATPCVIAWLDSTLLDVMLTLDQSAYRRPADTRVEGGARARRAKIEDDWMTRMLHSQAFIKLAPVEIQRLLRTLTSVTVSAGDTVIRQGQEGDYFYIIREGKCSVTRQVSSKGWDVPLAELSAGDCFGEEALVSDARRNATVTMLTDGHLMRLSKKEFLELLKKPLVHYVGIEEARSIADNGGIWLDVRLADECSNAMENSINIPLAEIREKAPDLSKDRSYIICCDTGRRSASAAFLLSQREFEVNVLEGGLNSVVPVNIPNPAAISSASRPARPGENRLPAWSIEAMDASRPAGSNMGDPVNRGPAKQGLSELEIIKQQRDALEKRIRELEMQLPAGNLSTTSR
jgi:CRP-like cAMP-binding protein/rhodanese-related sulfurtransferase